MRYTIPIIPDVTRQNFEVLFNHVNSNSIRAYFVFSLLGATGGAIALALPFSPIVQAISGAIFFAVSFISGYYFTTLARHKRVFLEMNMNNYKEPGEMTIELTDDYFGYEDHLQQTRMKWQLLRSYEVIGGILYIHRNITSYMINKRVAGEETYRSVLAYVEARLPEGKPKLRG